MARLGRSLSKLNRRYLSTCYNQLSASGSAGDQDLARSRLVLDVLRPVVKITFRNATNAFSLGLGFRPLEILCNCLAYQATSIKAILSIALMPVLIGLTLTSMVFPASNLLGQQGAGFAIGQARLGPARLHHCMRAIGECEVLISLMIKRAQERSTFGKRIDEYSSTQEAISLSRIELDQCRLLVQRAAHLLDTVGNKVARKQISMIKVAVARVYQSIADRAIQLYGARGVTNDTPAARAFGKARAFRIYDGPDEVHLQTIARLEAQEQDGELLEHYLM